MGKFQDANRDIILFLLSWRDVFPPPLLPSDPRRVSSDPRRVSSDPRRVSIQKEAFSIPFITGLISQPDVVIVIHLRNRRII